MREAEKLLADLTPQQREAVTHVEGPLLVVAGAGSGKTRVITRRVAYLALRGVPPHRLLAVTFTNKAADEMRGRIEQLAGTRGAWVSTFHSLCASMLRISADSIGLSRDFTIYDRDDQLKAVQQCLKEMEADTSMLQPAGVLQAISNAKTRLESPEQFAAAVTGLRDELIAKAYAKYQALLARNAALDFDDLLLRVALLLQGDEAFRDRWQRRFDFVLIDEYQDTNRAQYLIARELAARHRNLCATGDPDQAIYTWRGASIRNILEFTRDYPDARVVKLERNYRSTKAILRAADSLIVHNALRHERGLWTENPEGLPVRFLWADDADQEAQMVVQSIAASHAKGRRWRDFAVFYRTNAQSRSLEEAMRHRIPHRLIGAVQFYGRQEIKDLVAYLRVCVNELDDLSLERILNVPVRGIGDRTADRLRAWAAANGLSLRAAVAAADQAPDLGAKAKGAVKAFSDLLDAFRAAPKSPVGAFCRHVLDKSGYQDWLERPENEERKENVNEFLAKADKFDLEHPGGELAEFMQEVALVSDVDNLDPTADAVSLMTLHAAKGLEFPVVFLTGAEEGLLPHINALRNEEGIEEERRLCYVGMTRAKEELIITASAWRAQGGSMAEREPSRFLFEVRRDVFDNAGQRALASLGPDATLDAWDDAESKPLRSAPGEARPRKHGPPPPPRRPGGLAVGDRVRHPQLGDGWVLAIQRADKLTVVTVAMASGGKRLFALEYVALEKL